MNTAPSRRAKRLAANTAALTVGRLGSKALVFLLVRFYTYVLTNAEYGTADLITSLANFIIPLACAGLSSGFFRFAAETKSRREQVDVFTAGLCILLVSSMGFALLSPILFAVPYINSYVWLILAYVLCANLHYFVSEFVRARGNYQLFAFQGLINTALNIALNLLFLLLLSMGVEGYILSIVLADLATSVFLIVHCRLWRFVRPGHADRRLIGSMLRFCLPLIPASICWWITNASDRYMVTYFCGEAANGLYAAAYKIPNLLVIVAGIFTDAWQFSAVIENRRSQTAETSEERRARQRSLVSFFSTTIKGYAAFLFLAAAGMILLCRPLAALLFDPSFADAWQYVPVLILATVLSSLSNFTNSVYMVERRGVASFITSLVGAVANIALNLWFIPLWGALGAAIATALSYLIVLIIRLISTRRSIPYRYAPVWQFLCLGMLTAMTVFVTAQIRGRIIYIVILFLLTVALASVHLLPNLKALLRAKQKKQPHP